ncbi:MAG: WbqC family protein [Porphyromonadaceae bacterium]|nr:MAG: WbqC family protein [Porphyromonadaceae bacterium]
MWASRHGFQPGLSILDLLMNTGRESIYTLKKMLP